jgi:O-antigen/teichoic acid export membrane protein
MTRQVTIFRNTVVVLGANVVMKIITLFFLAFVANRLRTELYGFYNFALSYISLFGAFADLGLSVLVVQMVARDKAHVNRLVGNSLAVKLLLYAGTAVLIAGVTLFLGRSAQQNAIIAIAGLIFFISSTAYLFRSVFDGYERMEFSSMGDIVERVITFVLGVTVLLLGYSIFVFFLVLLLGTIGKTGYYWHYLRRGFARIRLQLDWRYCLDLLRQAYPFALGAFVGVLYFRINVVMLTIMKGDKAVGLYSAANDKVLGVVSIGIILSHVLFPTISRAFVESRETLRHLCERSIGYLIYLSLPMAVGTLIISKRVIAILHTPEYAPSALALAIMSPFIFFKFVAYGLGVVLSSINRQKLRVALDLGASILTIILNFALIRRYGYIGACIATVLTEVALLSATYYAAWRFIPGLNLFRVGIKPLLASAGMGAVALMLNHSNILFQIAMSGIVYALLLRSLGCMKEEQDIVLAKLKQILASDSATAR